MSMRNASWCGKGKCGNAASPAARRSKANANVGCARGVARDLTCGNFVMVSATVHVLADVLEQESRSGCQDHRLAYPGFGGSVPK